MNHNHQRHYMGILWFWCALVTLSASAVEVVPSAHPQHIFADGSRLVEVRLRNSTPESVQVAVRLQLLQLTSSTAAPVAGVRAWKTFTILTGQTLVENADIEFPQLRASTRFVARWLDADGKLLGVTDLWVHPNNLLEALKRLANGQPIGLADETGTLGPVLAAKGIPISDLNSDESWTEFRGRLAFVLSKPVKDQSELRPKAAMLSRTKAGLGVVWFQSNLPQPSPEPFVSERLSVGRGAVVVADAGCLFELRRSPTAQLALVRLSESALAPLQHFLVAAP